MDKLNRIEFNMRTKMSEEPRMNSAADSKLEELALKSAGIIYGEILPKIVAERIEKELGWITKNNDSSMFLIANEIAKKNNEDGEHIGFRGNLGSSLVTYLSGITDVNPLPPHYICTNCKHSEFTLDPKYYTCQDLPDKVCKKCGLMLQKEGYNIPAESFFGLNGERDLSIVLNISIENLDNTHGYLESYINENIWDILSRIDLVPNYGLAIIKNLEELTGTKRKSINLSDSEVLNLFSSKNILGIFEFEGSYEKNIIDETGVQSFSDLVKIFGITYGSSVWEGNQQDIIKSGKAKFPGVIATREDILHDLLNAGADMDVAFDAMRLKNMNEKIEQLNLPGWYLESLNKIRYLFSKAHCVHYTMLYVQLAWYKLYYPAEFYSTNLYYKNLELEDKNESGILENYHKNLTQYRDALEHEMKNRGIEI